MESIMEPIFIYFYEAFSKDDVESDVSDELTDSEVDDQVLSRLLQKTIHKRNAQGAEQAYYILHNPNRKFHDSLNNKLLFKYYFLLSVINFERFARDEMNQAYGESQRYFDEEKLGEEWSTRFDILSAIINSLNDNDNSLNLFSQWWSKNCESSNLPMLSLSIYFGTWAINNEKYVEAREILDRSLMQAKSQTEEAIVLSNKGALAYACDNFSEAITCYASALNKIESVNDHRLEKLRITLFENLKNMEIYDATTKQEYLIPENIRLLENDVEHAQRMFRIAQRHLTDEIYDELLRERQSFRASNNLYEAFRYFNNAERSYQLIGYIGGNKRLTQELMKQLVIAGKSLNNKMLQRVALEQAVLIKHEKTIKGLLGNDTPFSSKEDLMDFSNWLFNSGSNRVIRLGRVYCIGYLADYLPDEFITRAFEELWLVMGQDWSMSSEFDYKRTAIEALGRIFQRLNTNQQIAVVEEFLNTIQHGHPLVKHQVSKSLNSISDWSNYPLSELSNLTYELINFLHSSSNDDLENNNLLSLLIKISYYVAEEEQRKIAAFLLGNWRNGNINGINVFLEDHLSKYIDESDREIVIGTAIEKVKSEIKQTSGVFSIKAYEWGAILAYLLPLSVQTTFLQEAEHVLLDYIKTPNVEKNKRAEVMRVIFYLLQNKQEVPINRSELLNSCLFILDQSIIWKNEEPDFFIKSYNLLSEVFKVISQLDLPADKAERLINRFLMTSLLERENDPAESLIALKYLGKKWNDVPMIYMQILSRLYMECRSDDEHVRAAAVSSLVELAKNQQKDEICWAYALQAMDIGSKDTSRLVRFNLAYALQSLPELSLGGAKEQVTSVINTLRNDISFLVRKTLDRKRV